ncbi:DUF2231 domain-containing protein [Aurantimonas sp. A2-1-M11]|uniref:DUF2231 domain-containing protein n=1 Tax=Aurantimonas sp. A2-1-M11 TaxID=3113712 RepID=UPI003FA5500A
MDYPHPPLTATIGGQSIHAMLIQFPFVCFTLTLLTDIAYWQTGNLMWQEFSSWLLFAGLIIGGFALLAGLVDFVTQPRMRAQPPAWAYAIGTVVILVLGFVNSLVHAGDGWTAVVPNGLILSAVTVVLITITAWLGRSMVFQYGVGVRNHD